MKYKVEIEHPAWLAVTKIGGFFLLAYILKLTWGAVIPNIFNLPSLTYWQSAGILFLSWILIRGSSIYSCYKVKIEED